MSLSISAMRNIAFPSGYSGPARQKSDESGFDLALAELKELASKTPAERARDAVLKRHGLDEKSYAEMPEDSRKLLEREMAEAVQRAIQTKDQASTRFA